ncbi:hypothetical protein K1X13_03320 [Nocardioides sp. WL0053]|uniref:DUF222 domain-containing protein n=1 Tax=Nocardioides jiangsuensis TaxID=2866161 RepID=A0ABS7RFP2_9ACTN|nr:proline-rich domain-containing protein [Nocardioides jiangsuensis]MBY9073844.1 hypothetical protein [Nocardioides jiangsuensis]
MEAVIEDQDAAGTLASLARLRRVRVEAERDVFLLVAHFADLCHADSVQRSAARAGRVFTGMERAVCLGGVGTPLVREFAASEVAGELEISSYAARALLADVLDVRHRLPRLWARVTACEVATWVARKVAVATRDLTPEQALFVDAGVAEYADGRLSWSRFETVLEARVVEADPEAAAAREAAAAAEQFAKVGRSNEHGQKTLYVRSTAAVITRIDATLDYLCQALRALGETENADELRVKAMLLLANPLQAVELLTAYKHAHSRGTTAPAADTPGSGAASAAGGPAPGQRTGASGSTFGGSDEDEDMPLPFDGPASGPASSTTPDSGSDSMSGPDAGPPRLGEHDLHPGENDADDPPDPGQGTALPCPTCGAGPAWGGSTSPPASGAQSSPTGDPSPFTRPAWFRSADLPAPAAGRGHVVGVDWARLLPTVTLYVHLTDHTLATGHGVARWEGEGPVSARYVRDFLGPTSRFTIKPVIDLAGQAAVDAYEVPDRLREAVHLRTPADVFPYASNTSRRMDLDHTRPYRHTASAGQTRMDNLGPLGRFHHRVRTHGNWAVEQPFPGIYLWRAPHGSIYLVDHTGTRKVTDPWTKSATSQNDHTDGARDDTEDGLATLTPLETHFALIISEGAA